MANIQELDNQISIIEADKELLYNILTNKQIAGLSELNSLETYVKKVDKLSYYAMYDYASELQLQRDTTYPKGTYALVIKQAEQSSEYYDGTEETLYTSFAVPSRVQNVALNTIENNQEIVININNDYGTILGQLKVTNIDARLEIRVDTYTVKVYWNKISSEAGEYIVSKYEINGNDDYKANTNYILPQAVYLQLMTELENNNLEQALLQFMPQTNRIYDSLYVLANTNKWELVFKQLEYEEDTQIKIYNTTTDMNADTVDNYTIGIVLNTEEVLRLTTDVSIGNRIYKQLILGPEVEIKVPRIANRLSYTYTDTNYDVSATLLKEASDEDTRLVVLSSKDYRDPISEVLYTTDITYTYKFKSKVVSTEYDTYTLEIDSKSTYDSKLGITERVSIDSNTFANVEIDTPKTNTSTVTIVSNNCEILDGLFGKILYINNNQNNADNHWEFSGIYMYNGNNWQALALGLNASASTVFIGYKAYTDSGTVIGMGTADANAVASDILRGKTAYVNGVKITGTYDEINLDNELATQDSLLQTQTTSIEDVISALENKMATGLQEATSDATATANDIALNKTAYVNGQKLIGTYEVPTPTLELYDVLDIKHTGNVAFETNYIPKENTEIILEYEDWLMYSNTATTTSIFGIRSATRQTRNASSTTYSNSFGLSSNTYGNFKFGDQELKPGTSKKMADVEDKFRLKLNKTGIYRYNFNTNQYEIFALFSTQPIWGTIQDTMCLFVDKQHVTITSTGETYYNYHTTAPLNVKFHFMEIYENGVLKARYVPAKYGNEIGVYDTVAQKMLDRITPLEVYNETNS